HFGEESKLKASARPLTLNACSRQSGFCCRSRYQVIADALDVLGNLAQEGGPGLAGRSAIDLKRLVGELSRLIYLGCACRVILRSEFIASRRVDAVEAAGIRNAPLKTYD